MELQTTKMSGQKGRSGRKSFEYELKSQEITDMSQDAVLHLLRKHKKADNELYGLHDTLKLAGPAAFKAIADKSEIDITEQKVYVRNRSPRTNNRGADNAKPVPANGNRPSSTI